MIKHKIADLLIKDTKIRGIYRGVVEDIEDPKSAGRVRCRIHGLHTQAGSPDSGLSITETDGIQTDHLPWCEPAIPTIEFGIDGSGMFGIPQIGAHVLVFFENENILRPIYFAALPSKSEWNTDATSGVFIFKLPGGQSIEFDSNSGSETIKISHPTGTEIEIDSDGKIIITGADKADITLAGDININVTGNCNVTTTGTINLN